MIGYNVSVATTNRIKYALLKCLFLVCFFLQREAGFQVQQDMVTVNTCVCIIIRSSLLFIRMLYCIINASTHEDVKLCKEQMKKLNDVAARVASIDHFQLIIFKKIFNYLEKF
jgi:hypothetical protein